MAKSQDAFRTISEVSEWLDTPAHVLRFWESKFSQIKPVKRAGGRRYYRPDDMALLSGIKTLLHEQGMTIKGVQKLLREQGVKHVIEIGIAPDTGSEAVENTVIEAETIEATPIDAAAELPLEAEPETEPAAEPVHIEPAAWDPDDPWPADPVPAAPEIDAPEMAPSERVEEVAEVTPPGPFEAWPEDATASEAPEPEADTTEADAEVDPEVNPVMPPPRREVSLPFVRARSEAAEPPTPSPEAEILAFAPKPRPAIPDLPDETAQHRHPGALTAILGGDAQAIRANATRIAPLVGRLKVVADRITSGRG